MNSCSRSKSSANRSDSPRVRCTHRFLSSSLLIFSLSKTADELGLDRKKVKLNTAGDLGWHFRVSRNDEKALRKHSKYTSLETRKDGVRFTSTPMMKLDKSAFPVFPAALHFKDVISLFLIFPFPELGKLWRRSMRRSSRSSWTKPWRSPVGSVFSSQQVFFLLRENPLTMGVFCLWCVVHAVGYLPLVETASKVI